MTDGAIFSRIAALAQRIGVALANRGPAPWQWDGQAIAIRFQSGPLRAPIDILHDVSHFQVASRRRVGMPDFGLGPGTLSGPAPTSVNPAYALEEDNRASVLTLAHARVISLQWFTSLLRKLPYGLATWDDVVRSKATCLDVRWLARRGLVVDGIGTARTVRG